MINLQDDHENENPKQTRNCSSFNTPDSPWQAPGACTVTHDLSEYLVLTDPAGFINIETKDTAAFHEMDEIFNRSPPELLIGSVTASLVAS